jgi:multidrug transporter EmrE-like cation transporter
MNIDTNTVRLLGTAQLVVFVASMVSERLLASVVGSGNISAKLANISNNLKLVRISNLVALINSLAIVVLAVLFYVIFSEQYKIIALVALGCFLAEAITLAVSKIGAYGLVPLSQKFVEAGAPESSYFQTLAACRSETL